MGARDQLAEGRLTPAELQWPLRRAPAPALAEAPLRTRPQRATQEPTDRTSREKQAPRGESNSSGDDPRRPSWLAVPVSRRRGDYWQPLKACKMVLASCLYKAMAQAAPSR
jgi:hypothetical protein